LVFFKKGKKYIIDVFTGDCKNSGTDANVFLTMYGKEGNSGERKLSSSKSNVNKFERNQVLKVILLKITNKILNYQG
jgi:lipoxygenase homology domain-containing protein 1